MAPPKLCSPRPSETETLVSPPVIALYTSARKRRRRVVARLRKLQKSHVRSICEASTAKVENLAYVETVRVTTARDDLGGFRPHFFLAYFFSLIFRMMTPCSPRKTA